MQRHPLLNLFSTSPDRRPNLSDERGMTLVEVIAVVVLLALLYVVVGKNVFGQSNAAKAKLNDVKMNNVRNILQQYKLEQNTFPARLEDLITPSADVKKSGGVFTPLADEGDLKDIWGSNFVYIQENGGRSFLLKSLGADGIEGGEGVNQDVEKRP